MADDEHVSEYYKYRPLQHRHIRLLRLHPGGGQGDNGQIELDIVEQSLEDANFNALSYTWGPSTFEEEDAAAEQAFTTVDRCYPVLVDGRLVRVTKSLRDALRTLRDMEDPRVAEFISSDLVGPNRRAVHLWADGICINQEDLVERSHQVALMGDLYRKAKNVIAYVGPQGKEGRSALELCVTLSHLDAKLADQEEYSADGYNRAHGQEWTLRLHDPAFWDQVGASPPTAKQWADWALFLTRPWFTRTWVIQEAVLSGGYNTHLLCGRIVTQMISLLHGLRLFGISNWKMTISGQIARHLEGNLSEQRNEAMSHWLHHTHPYFWVLRAWTDRSTVPFSTAHRLMLPHTSCSEPRDNVYATIGFVTEWQNSEQTDHSLVVDYRLSIAEVFTPATLMLLNRHGNLDLLDSVAPRTSTDNVHGLPSWCPDYSARVKRHIAQPLLTRFGDSDASWHTSGASKYSSPKRAVGQNQLVLRGTLCGVVNASVSLRGFPGEPPRWLSLLKMLLYSLKSASRVQNMPNLDSLAPCLLTYDGDHGTGFASDYDQHKRQLPLALTSLLALGLNSGFNKDMTAQDVSQAYIEMRGLGDQIKALDPSAEAWLPDFDRLDEEVEIFKTQSDSKWTRPSDNDMPYMKRIHVAESDVAMSALRSINTGLEVQSCCVGRNMFISDGGLMGIAHGAICNKDEVWALAGSKIPIILRHRSDAFYDWLGEAYVDGMMFGELWPADENLLHEVTVV